MTVTPLDRRARRRADTRADIVAAAWELARASGLAGVSMRDLGDRVGMRAQSVYSYFASKDEIYDAMFRQGYDEFIAWMDASEPAGDALSRAQYFGHRFFTFCRADEVRYQLLFLRTLPGFEPSAESYQRAVIALDRLRSQLAEVGITDPEAIDLATAMMTGLTSQQLANDPDGDRWERLVDRATRMLVAEFAPALLTPQRRRR